MPKKKRTRKHQAQPKKQPPTIYNDRGEPFSKWKAADKFAYLIEHRYPTIHNRMTPEWKFHPKRKWRFDYAWRDVRVAVEIDGYGFGHQSIKGLNRDHTKMNAATERGWTVLKYTSGMLGSYDKAVASVDQVARVLTGYDPEIMEELGL